MRTQNNKMKKYKYYVVYKNRSGYEGATFYEAPKKLDTEESIREMCAKISKNEGFDILVTFFYFVGVVYEN